MAKYTTEVRTICENAVGLEASVGYNEFNRIITEACPKVFNFDFPIFDESYRIVLERKILKHFYTREIGEETVGLWKSRLDTKLNEIMPYYNKLYISELLEFNPLYTTDLTRKKDNEIDNQNGGTTDTTNNSTTNSTSQNTSSGQGSGTNTNANVDKYSDTPQGALTNVENGTYLTNARMVNDSATSTSTTSNTSNGSGSVTGNASGHIVTDNSSLTTEDYLEHVVGYESRSASKLLKEYRDTFLNIDLMVIEELEILFMQLW